MSGKKITRALVMADQATHNLTKEILELSKGKDIVDRYFDTVLAAMVLKGEMDSALTS